MTEKQITEEILRYLKDESYNYAVLIDGEWGSGKTFFVNNTLTKEINKQEANLNTNRSVNTYLIWMQGYGRCSGKHCMVFCGRCSQKN